MKHLARISAILPLAVTLVWLQFLPDRVPVHYNASGVIDGWGSKWTYLLLPIIVLVMGLIFFLVCRSGVRRAGADEKQQAHAAANVKVIRIVMLATVLMFTALQVVLLLAAGRAANAGAGKSSLPLNRVTVICIGVMMAVLGNFMPKAKMNSTVGFRCGWTMYNDVTWQKSNRFSGIVIILAGLVCIAAAALAPDAWAIPILLIALTAAVIVSLIYAHRVYREERGKE